MKHLFEKYNDDDVRAVEYQLNTKDAMVGGVITRCKYGYPSVILLNPGEFDGSGKSINYMSLSNVIWLTCPYLHDKIHNYESMGYVKKVQDFIDDDYEMVKLMKEAHASYYYMRKRLYNHFFGLVRSTDEEMSIYSTGIGGARDPSYIKCLHLHYAHSLVCEKNVAGRIVHHLLGDDLDCPGRNCDSAKEAG